MFQRFRIRRRNRAIVDALYAELVERARDPFLYTHCAVPDTVMGRFEALSIHVFLFLRRCRDEEELEAIAQDIVDRFITDVEDSIRELGVGDQSVPKRMRKLAGVFYERVNAYDPPMQVDPPDASALGEAFRGRALPKAAPDEAVEALARYTIEAARDLDSRSSDTVLTGTLGDEVSG